MFKAIPYPLLLSASLWLAASQALATPTPTLSLGMRLDGSVQNAQLLADEAVWPGAERLLATGKGLQLVNADGRVVSQFEGRFKQLDHRVVGKTLLVASLDIRRQQAVLLGANLSQGWGAPLYLPKRDFAIEGLCLYRDSARNSFVFLLGAEGVGEQWLVAADDALLPQALRVRGLSLPPQSEYCQVDDASDGLYVNEEDVGFWRYGAAAEAPLERQPVDLREPFGHLARQAGGLALVPGGLLALDPKAAALHLYQQAAKGWTHSATLALEGLDEPQQLSARAAGEGYELLLLDETGQQRARLNGSFVAVVPSAPVPSLPAQAQTDSVPSQGDAADDPAIWVNRAEPARSRVLGTDKKGGLLVYDLAGKQLQDLRVGRLNNVDVRSGFTLGSRTVDLAVASNRDHNSLHLFTIDPASGEVATLGEVKTPLKEIYGLCLFKDPRGAIHAIANDKDGSVVQYRLGSRDAQVEGELVRRFQLASQPEGCVVDDRRQRLFIGEEDEAVWALDLGDSQSTPEKVIGVGGPLQADIEGMALYQGAQRDYLVISSQGNDRYVVVEAQPPYTLRCAFAIGLNAALGIDGASQTDGLDVTSANLGGPWSQGLLVVQDGRKRMPEGRQNYKYLPWSLVAQALGLE